MTEDAAQWNLTATDSSGSEVFGWVVPNPGQALSAAQIAAALADEINSDYASGVTGYQALADSAGGLTVLGGTEVFDLGISVILDSGNEQSVIYERQITIAAADTVNSTGSTWTMSVTPAGGVATTIATWTDTSGGTSLSAGDVAAGLAGDVSGSDYSVVELANNGTLSGSTFTLSRIGTSFEVEVSVTRPSSSVVVVDANTVHERQITIAAEAVANSTSWTMSVTADGVTTMVHVCFL